MDVELLLSHPAPSEGSPLSLRALVRITGSAPEAVARTPLDLAVVLDRSGSMAGAKLAHARQAASLLLRRLRDEDRVSVVTYDSEVRTIVSGATGDRHHEAADALQGITAGDTTNLSGGWLRGRELVGEDLSEDRVRRILLLTDGLANCGITEPDALTGLCRKARDEGISTTTIGFGEGFDEDLLRAMADAGGGAAYYIEDPDQAPGIFEEEIEGLLSLAAQNVTLTLSPEAGTTLARIRHFLSGHGDGAGPPPGYRGPVRPGAPSRADGVRPGGRGARGPAGHGHDHGPGLRAER